METNQIPDVEIQIGYGIARVGRDPKFPTVSEEPDTDAGLIIGGIPPFARVEYRVRVGMIKPTSNGKISILHSSLSGIFFQEVRITEELRDQVPSIRDRQVGKWEETMVVLPVIQSVIIPVDKIREEARKVVEIIEKTIRDMHPNEVLLSFPLESEVHGTRRLWSSYFKDLIRPQDWRFDLKMDSQHRKKKPLLY